MRVATLELPGPELPRARQVGSDAVALLLVGAAYLILARLGLGLASINPSVTPIWPPTGLDIAAILLWGYRIAPAIFVASFLINQLTAGSIFTSLAIASGNTLEAVIAGYLVMHRADGDQVFDTAAGITKFVLICVAATLVSATIGVSSLAHAGYVEASSFIPVWLTWWLGDFGGPLLLRQLWCSGPERTSITARIAGKLTTFQRVHRIGKIKIVDRITEPCRADQGYLTASGSGSGSGMNSEFSGYRVKSRHQCPLWVKS